MANEKTLKVIDKIDNINLNVQSSARGLINKIKSVSGVTHSTDGQVLTSELKAVYLKTASRLVKTNSIRQSALNGNKLTSSDVEKLTSISAKSIASKTKVTYL